MADYSRPGEFLETVEHEPASNETLNLEPGYRHGWNNKEYVRIGVISKDARGPNGTISFQLVQYNTDWKCEILQACLTASDIDLVIQGLQDAKTRMQAVTP